MSENTDNPSTQIPIQPIAQANPDLQQIVQLGEKPAPCPQQPVAKPNPNLQTFVQKAPSTNNKDNASK